LTQCMSEREEMCTRASTMNQESFMNEPKSSSDCSHKRMPSGFFASTGVCHENSLPKLPESKAVTWQESSNIPVNAPGSNSWRLRALCGLISWT